MRVFVTGAIAFIHRFSQCLANIETDRLAVEALGWRPEQPELLADIRDADDFA